MLSKCQILNHLLICIIGMLVIKYPIVTNNKSYALFERNNLKIDLVVLYVSVNIKSFVEKGEVKVIVCKSIKSSCLSKHYHTREKKGSFINKSRRNINGRGIG